jgi:hypothetical protein
MIHRCPSLISEPLIFETETVLEDLITCKSAGTNKILSEWIVIR